jgi:putative flippase GtrA
MKKQFFYFSIVGTIGFVVDTSVLYLIYGVIGVYYSRIVSFTASVATTFIINSKLTFKSQKSGAAHFILYFIMMIIGGTVNVLTYVYLVSSYPYVHSNPIIGVAAGSIAGLLINFTTSKYIVFALAGRKHKKISRKPNLAIPDTESVNPSLSEIDD